METKLEADREIRRLVVAQMADCAANAALEADAARLSGWLVDIPAAGTMAYSDVKELTSRGR